MSYPDIIQISDLHITDSTHEKIIYATNELLKQITPEAIIVVCGDIFNNKNRLKEKDIVVFHKFLELLKNHEVILIPGNHDFEVGATRTLIDTVMINTRYENVHVCTDFKKKVIRGITFYTLPPNVVDDTTTFIKTIKEDMTSKKFLVIHEPIGGCKFYAKGGRFNVNDFPGVLGIMAGDIHKPCISNTNPKLVFSGSFIQKNLSESEKHGYILWKDFTPQFIPVQQVDVVARIILEDDKISEKSTHVSQRDKCKYVKVMYKNCSKEWLKNAMERITKKYKKIDKIICKDELKDIDIANFNLFEFSNHEQLIKSQFKFPNMDEVLKLHHEKYTKHFTASSRKKWTIDFLAWDNLFCYSFDNYFDFRLIKGLTGIVGANGIGKSSFINILLFMLYNKIPNAKANIGNIHEDNWRGFCKITVHSNSPKSYLIHKKGKKTSKKFTGMDIYLYEYVDTGLKNISEIGAEKTQEKIETMIGTLEFIEQTNILLQSHHSYTDQTPPQLLESLITGTEFMYFDHILDESVKTLKEAKRQKQECESVMKLTDLEVQSTSKDIRTDITEYRVKLEAVKKLIYEYRSKSKTENINAYTSPPIPEKLRNEQVKFLNALLQDQSHHSLPEFSDPQISEYVKKYTEFNNPAVKELLSALSAKNLTAEEILEFSKTNKHNLLSLKSLHTKDLDLLNGYKLLYNAHMTTRAIPDEYETLDLPVLIDQKNRLIELGYDGESEEPPSNFKENLHTLYITATNIISSEFLQGLRFNENCTHCVEINTKLRGLIVDKNNKLLAWLKWVIEGLNTKLLEKIKTKEIRLQKISQAITKLSFCNEKTLNLLQTVKEAKKNNGDIVVLLKSYLKKIQQYEYINSKDLEFLKTHNLNELLTQEKNFTEIIDELNKELGAIAASDKLKKDKKEYQQKLTEAEATIALYENYVRVMDRGGIRKQFIDTYLDAIENGLNLILTKLTTFKVQLVRETTGVSLKVNNVNVTQASGAQKFIIDMCMRLCLVRVLPACPEFLIIDEGFGSLDQDHLIYIQEYLTSLGNLYNDNGKWIIYISHIEELQIMAEHKNFINVTEKLYGGLRVPVSKLDNTGNLGEDFCLEEVNDVARITPSEADIEERSSKDHYCKYCDKSFGSRKLAKNHVVTQTHKNNFEKNYESFA